MGPGRSVDASFSLHRRSTCSAVFVKGSVMWGTAIFGPDSVDLPHLISAIASRPPRPRVELKLLAYTVLFGACCITSLTIPVTALSLSRVEKDFPPRSIRLIRICQDVRSDIYFPLHQHQTTLSSFDHHLNLTSSVIKLFLNSKGMCSDHRSRGRNVHETIADHVAEPFECGHVSISRPFGSNDESLPNESACRLHKR